MAYMCLNPALPLEQHYCFNSKYGPMRPKKPINVVDIQSCLPTRIFELSKTMPDEQISDKKEDCFFIHSMYKSRTLLTIILIL